MLECRRKAFARKDLTATSRQAIESYDSSLRHNVILPTQVGGILTAESREDSDYQHPHFLEVDYFRLVARG